MGKEVPKRVIMVGNTKLVIYSHLMAMTPEEQKEWFESERKKGNPVLKEIERVANRAYREKLIREKEELREKNNGK